MASVDRWCNAEQVSENESERVIAALAVYHHGLSSLIKDQFATRLSCLDNRHLSLVVECQEKPRSSDAGHPLNCLH
jgi:ribosome-associated toxin RatA of RatAB toxin-antitoxin module